MSDQRVSAKTEQVSEATTDEATKDGEVVEREPVLADADLKEGTVTDLFSSDPLSAEDLEKLAFQQEGMFEPAEALAGAVDGGFVDAMGNPIDTAGGSIGDLDGFGDTPEGRGDILDVDLLGTSDMPAEQQIGDPTVSGLFGDAIDAIGGAAVAGAKFVYETVTGDGPATGAAGNELPDDFIPITNDDLERSRQQRQEYESQYKFESADGDGGAGITFTEALEQEQLRQDSVINPSNEDDGGDAPLTDENGEPLFIRKSDGYTDPVQEQVDVQLIDPETAILRFNEAGPEYDPNADPIDIPDELPPDFYGGTGGTGGGGGDGGDGGDGGGGTTPTEG